MSIYEHCFTADLYDIDEKNRLSTKSLLKFMQEIGSFHSSLCGYGVNDVERTGVSWFLLNWKVEILSRPAWNSKILIKTWPRKNEKVYSYRDYLAYDEAGNLVARVSSKWVLLNVKTHSIQKITGDVEKAYQLEKKQVFEDEIIRLKEPEHFDREFIYTTLRRDIDTNGHVNNLNYIDFAYEALPEEVYQNASFRYLDVMYKKECKVGETIRCLYTQIDENEHMVTMKSEDNKTLHCIVHFKSW